MDPLFLLAGPLFSSEVLLAPAERLLQHRGLRTETCQKALC